MIRFHCYYCHRLHEVEESAAGKRGRCLCGRLMAVPSGLLDLDAASAGAVPVARPWVAESADAGPAVELKGGILAPAPAVEVAVVEPPSGPVPRPRRSRLRRLARGMWGCILIALSLAPLGAWAVHRFRPAELAWLPGAPGYFGIPSAFWSTVLLTLFLGLTLEGFLVIVRDD